MDMKKMKISVFSGLVAAVIQLPQTYALTNKILPLETFRNGCPTLTGKMIHLIVFFIITYLSMKRSDMSDKEILHNSIFSATIYYLTFSKDLILLIDNALKLNLMTNGCVNNKGLMIQTCLYVLCLYGIMFL
jgi:hypothetical protein